MKIKVKTITTIFLLLLFILSGCVPTCAKLEPKIVCTPSTYQISNMPSAFPPLSEEEKQQEWGKELYIGNVLAKEWDLYRAITAYKRALILLPPDYLSRQLQIHYNLLFAYYLGNKYQEVIDIFESSSLAQAGPEFPAFNNLLIILYDSYLQSHMEEKASCIKQAIEKYSSETAEDLDVYTSITSGDIETLDCLATTHRQGISWQSDLDFYKQYAKSPTLARRLNAILPGAGYYYVGQKKSALTSLVINTLFTWASYEFFHRGYIAAGCITTSLELGWYLGGINGAGLEAQEFNNRLFEGMGKKILTTHSSFPLLMFETSF